MSVTITITGEDGQDAFDQMEMFYRAGTNGTKPAPFAASGPVFDKQEKVEDPAPEEEKETKKNRPKGRVYGEPGEGRARRLKEQIETDKEIEELTKALGIEIDMMETADRLVMALREQSNTAPAKEEPEITKNPEDRKEPEAEAVTGEIVDATREDVRDLLGKYAEKFGMAEAQKNGPALLGAPKLSEIPDDATAYDKAVKNLTEALNG